MWFLLLFISIQATVIEGTCNATLNDFVPYREGTKVTFTCTIHQCVNYNGSYPHLVTWYKSGSSVTAGVTSSKLPDNASRSTLVMTLQRSDNTKVIECRSPAADTVSKTLNVTFQPDITIKPSGSSVTVTENDSVTLTCEVKASNPVPVMSEWKFGTSIISSNLVLTLTATRIATGVYLCSVGNSVGVTVASTELRVEYGPRTVSLTPSTSVYNIKEGVDKMPPVNCSADCNPPCNYRWGEIQDVFPVLDLGLADRQDAGIHTCRAFNKIGNATAHINVTVRYPPYIAFAETEDREEGDGYWMRCDVRGVPDNYTFHGWYQKYELNGSIVRTGNLTSTGDVYLSDLSYMHNGIYYCSVSNGVTDTGGDAVITGPMGQLWINGPPHDLQSLYTGTGHLSTPVTFHVDFFQFSKGQITVSWYNLTSGEVVTPGRSNITVETIPYKTKFYSTDVTINGYRIVATIHEISAWNFGFYVVNLERSGQKRVVHLRVDREDIAASEPVNGWLVSTVILLVVVAGFALVAVWMYRRGISPRCREKKGKDAQSGVVDSDGQTYSDSPTIDAVTYDPSVYTPLQIRQQSVPEGLYSNVQSESEHAYACLKTKENRGQGSPQAESEGQQELSSGTEASLYQNVNVKTKNKKQKHEPPIPNSKQKLPPKPQPKKSRNTLISEVHSNGAFTDENM